MKIAVMEESNKLLCLYEFPAEMDFEGIFDAAMGLLKKPVYCAASVMGEVVNMLSVEKTVPDRK